jgi:hypothetical protein
MHNDGIYFRNSILRLCSIHPSANLQEANQLKNWTKIKNGKLRASNINAYEAVQGIYYCSVACESLEQAKELRRQILKKIPVLKIGKEVKAD